MSFTLESAGHEAKEQKSPERYACRVLREFQRLCGGGDLSDFESAWTYYESLSSRQRLQIREYQISPGKHYLKDLYNRVQNLHPSGTAGVVGQYLLQTALWAEFNKSLDKSAKCGKKPNKNLNKPGRRS